MARPNDNASATSYTVQTGQYRGRHILAWQLQEAKQRFSELVRRAQKDGPQVVTRHGEEVVVVVPAEEWRRMSRGGEKRMGFKEFLMSAPEGLEMIILNRPKGDYSREVDLTGEDREA